jgi:hypothetical protein
MEPEPHAAPLLAESAAAASALCTDDVGAETQYFCRILREMVAIGAELNHLVLQEAKANSEAALPPAGPGPSPVQQATLAYDCVTRAMRRTMMLHEKLFHTKQKSSPSQRSLARRKIIRDVEDAINSNAPADEQEILHAELLDRLDRPDLDNEIAVRPIADIVIDITHDLGIAGLYGSHPWKRRIPHDIAILNARADQIPGAALSEKLLALLASAPPRPAIPAGDPPDDDEDVDIITLAKRLRRLRGS